MSAARAGADAVARNEFRVFDLIANEIALADEDRRRVLRLSTQQWLAWSRLRNAGAVPQEPILSVMLRRLAAASYCLAVAAERIGEAGPTESAEWAAAA